MCMKHANCYELKRTKLRLHQRWLMLSQYKACGRRPRLRTPARSMTSAAGCPPGAVSGEHPGFPAVPASGGRSAERTGTGGMAQPAAPGGTGGSPRRDKPTAMIVHTTTRSPRQRVVRAPRRSSECGNEKARRSARPAPYADAPTSATCGGRRYSYAAHPSSQRYRAC